MSRAPTKEDWASILSVAVECGLKCAFRKPTISAEANQIARSILETIYLRNIIKDTFVRS